MNNQKAIMVTVKERKNGKLTPGKIGFVYTPKTNFSGGEIKWYQDTYKTEGSN